MMFDLTPLYTSSGLALAFIVIGYACSFLLLQEGSSKSIITAAFMRLLFMAIVPGLCAIAILSSYLPFWSGPAFFLWIIYVCVLTSLFIHKTRALHLLKKEKTIDGQEAGSDQPEKSFYQQHFFSYFI